METVFIGLAHYFAENAPIIIVLGYIVYVLWHDSKEQRRLTRENELENLEVLRKLSFILEKTTEENRSNFKEVRNEVNSLQTFVGSKIDRLEDKLVKR